MFTTNKRFFLFTFHTTKGPGYIDVSATGSPAFPNRKGLIEFIKKKKELEGLDVIITGWTEFKSESDYNAFKSEDD